MTRRNVASAPHEGSDDTAWFSILPILAPVFTVASKVTGLFGRRPS